MAINFPDSPSIGNTHTVNDYTWEWDGVSWIGYRSAGLTGGLEDFPVSANTVATVTANGINFTNTSSILVDVDVGITGNANVSLVYTDEILTKDNLWERGNATNTANPTISSTVTLDCSDSNVFKLNLNQSITLAAPTNPKSGQVINIQFKQDAVGGRLVTFDSIWIFASNTVPDLTTTPNARDLMSCQYDSEDSVWLCVMSNDFAR